MIAFSKLFSELDATTSTNRKISALVAYFRSVPPEDAVWTVSFMIGRKPRQVVPTRRLMAWAAELGNIPEWLFEASYDVVGDLAETITLLLPEPRESNRIPLHIWVERHLLPLREKDSESQRREVVAAWNQMDRAQRFVWNKLITGGFRVGVSRKLVVRALAEFSGVEPAVITHRLMGAWMPDAAAYERILAQDTRDADISRPYPFFLAHPLEGAVDELGSPADWHLEWKWDGIRGQVIRREGRVFIWSRGEELVTDKYPELRDAAADLPNGTVIDGEILPWKGNGPLPFSELQRRIGRKQVGRKLLAEVPVVLAAYDLLELDGSDVRQQSFADRRAALEALLKNRAGHTIRISPGIPTASWPELERLRNESRARGVEGFMLKRRASPYGVGRKRGDWWKWKVDPFSVDAVLVYAQRGHGRRSGLFTDYTFAVWDDGLLVPFAKAYSGLSDAEIRQVDRFIQRNTVERFGPVRAVRPELVFEIAFEGIQHSSRHKSGVAVRFPRIARWRTDKKKEAADTLAALRNLLHLKGGGLRRHFEIEN
jgi:DNA ligase-1